MRCNSMVLTCKRIIVVLLMCLVCVLGYTQEVNIHVEEAGMLLSLIHISEPTRPY